MGHESKHWLKDAAPVALQVPATSSGWKAWNRFRTLCDHHVRLCCALELTVDKTSEKAPSSIRLAEPVRCVILSPSTFLLNRSGYPVLPKKAKALLEQLFRRQVQVIIAEPQSVEQNEGLLPRLSYIARLFQDNHPESITTAVLHHLDKIKACRLKFVATDMEIIKASRGKALPPLSQAERFAYSHMDTLQAPLQPLADNLESETYELFETDPVKYAKYQEAVFIFLTERKQEGRPMPFCVMVLGAGRGPLVEAALKAAERAEVEVDLYAVEKNPNAVQALRHRKRRDGWSSVQADNRLVSGAVRIILLASTGKSNEVLNSTASFNNGYLLHQMMLL
eukprot:g19820.t1